MLFAAALATPGAATAAFFPASFFAQPASADAPIDPNSHAMALELRNQAFGVAPQTGFDCRSAMYGLYPERDPLEKAECHQSVGRASIAVDAYAPTVYRVGADQPTVPVIVPSNANLKAALAAVPVPDDAVPAEGTDGQAIVYQAATDTMWEFWRLKRMSDGWHAAWGGRIRDVSTNPGHYRDILNLKDGCGPSKTVRYCEQHNWGGPAARVPNLPGLITREDWERGWIDHALVMAVPSATQLVWTWPAQATDGSGSSLIPEGTRLKLPADLDLNQWFASLQDRDGSPRPIPPALRMIADALQRYGAVVVNQSASVAFYAENWKPGGVDPWRGETGLFGGELPYQFLTDLPWERLVALQSTSCVQGTITDPLHYEWPCVAPAAAFTTDPTARCKPPTPAIPQADDTTGPSLTITTPVSALSRNRTNLTAQAVDASGVTHVDFLLDGQLRYSSNYPVCAANKMQYRMGGQQGFWQPRDEASGPHRWEARAYDSQGNMSSATLDVNVAVFS